MQLGHEDGVELTDIGGREAGNDLAALSAGAAMKFSAPKHAIVEGMIERQQPFPIFFIFPLFVGLLFVIVGQAFNHSQLQFEARESLTRQYFEIGGVSDGTKAFEDIQSFDDVYSWLDETLLPALPYQSIVERTNPRSRWNVFGFYVGQTRSAPSIIATDTTSAQPTVALFPPDQKECAGSPLVVGYPPCQDGAGVSTFSCDASTVIWREGVVDPNITHRLTIEGMTSEEILLEGVCNAASTPGNNLTGTWAVGECIDVSPNVTIEENILSNNLIGDHSWKVQLGCEGPAQWPPLFKTNSETRSHCPQLVGLDPMHECIGATVVQSVPTKYSTATIPGGYDILADSLRALQTRFWFDGSTESISVTVLLYSSFRGDSSSWGVNAFVKNGNRLNVLERTPSLYPCSDVLIEAGIKCSKQFVVATIVFTIQVGSWGDISPVLQRPNSGVYTVAVIYDDTEYENFSSILKRFQPLTTMYLVYIILRHCYSIYQHKKV
jgi:hypothetical protein